MADHNTPFLPKTQSDLAYSESYQTPDRRHRSLDDTIERCIGDFGWAQFLQALLVSLAWVFDAQQTFITVFSDAKPTWHCTQLGDDSCNSFSDVCRLPKAAWAWDSPPHSSIVSEWSLQCAGWIVAGLPASSFFAGCLVGGLALSTLADSSLGRKKTLLFSCLLMSLAGVVTAAAPNIWVYSALKFACGFGRGTIGSCALVLSTELVGKRWRSEVGVVGFFCSTLGFVSLPAIAYFNRGSSWRLLYLWVSVPPLLYCVFIHFLVRESPRWLFVKGQKEEFIETLRSIATASASGLTLSFSDVSMENKHSENVDLYSAIKLLVEKGWAIRRLSAVMAVGIGVGMVYYAMPLGLGDLGFNLYLSVTLNALSEVPASALSLVSVGRLKRKSAVMGFTMFSGACSIMCVAARDSWKGAKIAAETLSFLSDCTAFSVLMIYSLELFPTCVRSSAMSMVRQAVVLGGVVGPFVVAAGRGNGGAVSYGVFGVSLWCCGLFVACLPETKGGTLCDTMDEEESKVAHCTTSCPAP